MSIFGDDVNYNLEFRSTIDDGWYICGVVLDHHRNHLRVKFKDFECKDEVFTVSDFSTNDDVRIFVHRFRPESELVGDDGCSRVYEGLTVSAACTGGKYLRKFDAIVQSVCNKKHTPERCLCTCLLYWQHGPEDGRSTAANLVDVYLIKSGSVDPAVVNFTNLVKEKVKGASSKFTLIPNNPCLSKGTSSNETITRVQDLECAGPNSHDRFSAGSERFYSELSDQGIGSGCVEETSSYHYLILENLETDLCPSYIRDFILEHILIAARVYVVPNLLSEPYTRAAIVVDDRIKLERIYGFLNNPNHFIVSSSGRPWVLAEDKLRTGTFNTNLHGFMPMSENGNGKKVLKVVRSGTEEYTKAKQQNDLYLTYRNHLNGLLRTLAMREENMNGGPA